MQTVAASRRQKDRVNAELQTNDTDRSPSEDTPRTAVTKCDQPQHYGNGEAK